MDKELKEKLKVNTVVFLWILLCNLLVQLLLPSLSNLGFYNWAFFLINILFFLVTEGEYRERFISVILGSAIGIFAAGMMDFIMTKLILWGTPDLWSIMIPLAFCLAVIIILHPVLPRIFNNCGFAYFLVSLIDAEAAFDNMPEYMASALAGHLIVNTGTVAIIIMMLKKKDSVK